MFSDQSSEIALEKPCRTLAPMKGDRFVAGSSCAQSENQLFLLKYHSEMNELTNDVIIPTEGAVTSIATCPTDANLLLLATQGSSTVSLNKLPALCSTGEISDDISIHSTINSSMEVISTLECSGEVVDIVWRDGSDDFDPAPGNVITVEQSGCVRLWDVAEEVATAVRHDDKAFDNIWPPRIAWDPHSPSSVAVTRGSRVELLDWRSDTSVPSEMVPSLKAHRYGVMGIDYNPNKPYVLATAGQEGIIKFWDTRHAKQPLLVTRGGHSHWASSVKYNPFHDQLVLSTGTDAVANLWRISTISSAPLLTLEDEKGAESTAEDMLVQRFEHSESVYASCWSSSDAWIYMTVGFDGKAVLSHVPSKEKYKILL